MKYYTTTTKIYTKLLFFTAIAPEPQEVQKKKLTMSFEEYKNLSNMLILYMRSEEARAENEGER